jgi:ribosome biogenesis GTPase
VSLEHNHVIRVQSGDDEWLAETAGRLKFQAAGRSELPAVGDWVAVRPPAAGGRALIRSLLPRRTWFSRRAAGRETVEQVVAANVDVVFLVFALDRFEGEPPLRAIERYLVLARQSGALPVVILSKADLVEDAAGAVASAADVAGGPSVLAVSARLAGGIDPMRDYLEVGRTVALLGPSGAGKSSLVNRLLGEERLPTGEVRPWDARGRHTSVHRELVVRAEGGVIIDTPGMRELQLWEPEAAVDETFADVGELSAGCRFRDCGHDREPGCAVKAAVDAGVLPAARYQSYVKLRAEQAAFDRQRDEKAALETKRLGRIGSRAIKAMQKQRGR